MDFKTKSITQAQKDHYIMIKESIQEEDTMFINIYEPNIGAPTYIKQILSDRKRDIDCNTVIVGDFSIPAHQWADHPNRKCR